MRPGAPNISAVHVRARWRAAPVLAVLVLVMLGAPSAHAEVDPEVTALSGDLAALRRDLEVTSARIMGNREQQVVLAGRISELNAQVEQFRARVATTESEIEVLVAQREAILKIVRARAAQLYVHREVTSPLEGFDVSAPMRIARRHALAEAVTRRDESERSALKDASDKLAVTRDELARQRDELQTQENEVQSQQRALEDLGAQIRAEQADLSARAKDVQGRLQGAIAAGVIRAGGPSLLGPTNLSGPQLAAWWRAQGYPTPSLSVSIDQLAQLYVDEGNAEGVRGDLAFAQAVLETGGFRYTAPGNNFAGMGWCDSCAEGRSFPTPMDGVRAQIQHLKNYGDPISRAVGLGHPASVYWYAPTSKSQQVANENFDTFFAKGWALTWNQMGNGNWATDPNYSAKVLKIYASMVAARANRLTSSTFRVA